MFEEYRPIEEERIAMQYIRRGNYKSPVTNDTRRSSIGYRRRRDENKFQLTVHGAIV